MGNAGGQRNLWIVALDDAAMGAQHGKEIRVHGFGCLGVARLAHRTRLIAGGRLLNLSWALIR